MYRRKVMQISGASLAIAATGGTVSANHHGLDASSGYHPQPAIEATVTIDGFDGSRMSSLLEYIDDSGDVADLRDYGARVRPRDNTDTADDSGYNPVTLRADRLANDFYTAFPRDATADVDSDDEKEDVSAIYHSGEWSKDMSGSGGSMTISNTNGEADDVLELDVSGTSGDVARADLDLSAYGAEVDSAARNFVQAVVNVSGSDADTVVNVKVHDGSNTKTVQLADGDGNGMVTQIRIEDASGDAIDQVDMVSITVEEGSATVEVVGLDIERPEKWEFGTQEYYDSTDENLDTQTVEEPSGTFDVLGFDGLSSAFTDAEIVKYDVDADFRLAESDQATVYHEFTDDAQDYGYDERLRMIANIKLPAAIDLSYASEEFVDEVVLPGSRHISVERATDMDDPVTLDEYDDDEDSVTDDFVDRTSDYNDGSADDTISLSSSITPGDEQVLLFDAGLRSDWRDELEDTGGAIGGPTGQTGGGGIIGFLSSIPGMIASGLSLGILARWFSGD